MMLRRFAFLLSITVSLGAGAGCLYWPHQQQRSPQLQGRLLREGAPQPGVPVRLKVNPPRQSMGSCLGETRATSDEAGRFVVPPTAEHESWIVMGDRRDVWQLCFELPGDEKVTWFGSGWWGGPKAQRLSCELGAARPRQGWALPPLPDEKGLGCRELPEGEEGGDGVGDGGGEGDRDGDRDGGGPRR